MNFNLLPSLQHFALTKIAVVLCNNHEIKALLAANRGLVGYETHGKFFTNQNIAYFSILERSRFLRYANAEHTAPHHNASDLLGKIQDKAKCMISLLNLATSCEKGILGCIPYIVQEIEKWESDHTEILTAGYDAQVYFCWKSVGTIDRESTAENLLIHGNLPIKNRFYLACAYCMQDHLSSLWDSIYDSHKAYLISKCNSRSLINYWTTRIDGLHSRRSVFPDTSYITNVSALQYFYNECRGEDKKQAFLNDVLGRHWKNPDLVRFCVSKLCQNDHKKLSSLQCRRVVRCFLNWPLQSSFLDASECLLVKQDLAGIKDLLHEIHGIINTHKYVETDYLNLLKDFWKQIPSCHKDSLMNAPDFQPIKAVLEESFT